MPLGDTAHRPWPAPATPWVLAMQWHSLLFAHWPVPAASLRALLPPGLELETYGGEAWLGVVPFQMRGTRPRYGPAVPGVSAFPELNVRTYVTAGGKPGVWFFSLDAASPLAVEGARAVFHLPYFHARMACDDLGGTILYRSRRAHPGAAPAELHAHYRPAGPVYRSTPGSLEHWLTERYCLYAADRRGHLWRGEIHHEPWPLQPATAELALNRMADQIGVTLPPQPPLLHFVRRLDVVGWAPERLR
ncbi:DUF2071 domain-containing protein [Chloroflexia bacterium SDU3-3]|nr:DUF2071 domain-containing protein [Chloroflexia bacterium SDU3-3]